MILRSLACLAASLTLSTVANATIISLSPADINGGDTNTVSFSNGELTLTPLEIDATNVAAPSTFNANAVRLGIDTVGTNLNAFNDPDTTVGNAGDQLLTFDFVATSGLTQISYDFSRADGPGANDGVVISGFLADPGVTFSVADANLFAVYDGAGSVRLNLPGGLFNGTLREINFDPTRSAGQTLTLTVNDTTQAGAQLAIRGIAYDNATVAIPEPSSLAALGLVGLGVVARRRKQSA